MTQQPDHPSQAVFPPLAESAYVLTGPTASGKSAVAMEWAKRVGGEILSLDSIAVYKSMDIGSAKPSAADRSAVQHHLIDLVCPDQEFSVACYLKAAHQAVAEVRSRGRVPIFVGGTPMYLKAILRGFDPGPPADASFRQAAEKDLATYGVQALHRRLRQVDPLAAHRIQPNDARRMIRALEVAYLTGTPISHRQTQFENAQRPACDAAYVIRRDRDVLHQRIQQRVDAMFRAGLIEEVKSIVDRHGEFSRTARQGVGYREVLEYLEGKWTLPQCQQQVLFHTRRLVRRQETWFRSFTELQSLTASPSTTTRELVLRLPVEKLDTGRP